ncbi:MAG: energy transducer TonB [Rhodanobacteraceae bacterium]
MSASIRTRSLLSVAIVVALLLGLSACGNNGNAPANNAVPGQPAKTGSAAAKPVTAPASASTHGRAQAQAEQTAQAAQARMDSLSVKDLLAAGNTAINQQRLVSPKGDNAFEYYEKALQKDPKNQAAQDALREQFPFGANAIEQSIAQNNFDDSQREIALLANADPGNYTLKILNSKLDAAKKQQQRLADQKAKAADLVARQAAEAKAAAAKAASTPPPVPPPDQKPVVQAQPAPPPVQAVPKPAPPPQPAGETRAAQVVTPAAPEYPIQAARNRQSGYATVEFTVGADGSVSGAHVINSSSHVFDGAAIQAVSRSKFKPALKDGQPLSSTLQRRIDFNLGG